MRLSKYLSPVGAWALAFGCSVGWGSFVMPGTTFLPLAGPVGTALGLVVGALVMLVIGVNYHYLINRFPSAGGTYAYAKECFNYDHGFLCAWFLLITYVAIIWANATALPLIARNVFGGLFQVGFHYEVAGFQVYMGEVLLAIGALALATFACMHNKVAQWVQVIMALALFGGIAVCLFTIVFGAQAVPGADAVIASKPFEPAFSPERAPLQGIVTVVALAPWAFVGFESICHSSSEFAFPVRKTFKIMVAAIVAGALAYAALALLAVLALPEGCSTWTDYIGDLGSYEGLAGLPTFYAATTIWGRAGVALLGIMALGGIATGLVGNIVASSRLLFALAQDELLPAWFGKVDENRVPQNAILFLFLVSIILPFCGRTAISWIVDVTTVGATIAYAYASAAALKSARIQSNRRAQVTGAIGLVISLVFAFCFLAPNLMAVTTLSTESYLILATWGILGLVFFLHLFRHDDTNRFGHSTITWVVLLALIIFTSTVWVRQETFKAAEIGEAAVSSGMADPVEALTDVSEDAAHSTLVQTWLIVIALGILFYTYSLMQKRERRLEVAKALAEENSRAKTSFLSNMSHEIRTPMNAIIGLDNIALKDPDLPPRTREQLEKIGSSAKHLLSLINDILDMSRIESGRMVLKSEEFAFSEFLDQINVIINGQCVDKGLVYECNVIGRMSDYYVGDDMKLRQVLINILGNSVKFTEVPGTVSLTVEQIAEFEGHCTLRFVMADTGIGMSKDYIPKIFEAFSQEDGSVANKYGSTGLGMAITKNIVEMMNGDIDVQSEQGVGSTFTVTVSLKASSRSVRNEHADSLPEDLRVLVVDDDEVACEHAQLVAGAIGLKADYYTDCDDALDAVRRELAAGTPYAIVLTDYRMPGMDGVEFARAVHEFDGGQTAIIILTGYNQDDVQREAEASGIDGVLAKPLFTDSLLRQVRYVLEGRAQEWGMEGASQGSDDEVADDTLEGLRVLIAEDFEINAEILIDLLDMEGIEAEHAENGQIAVDMFDESEADYYDAVLMDVRMPVMDGLTATRTIRGLDREDARSVPIIALTANAFDEDVQRSLQAGMSAHLSKPVEPDRLYDTLRQLVAERRERH